VDFLLNWMVQGDYRVAMTVGMIFYGGAIALRRSSPHTKAENSGSPFGEPLLLLD
jgi:hypothetical protein